MTSHETRKQTSDKHHHTINENPNKPTPNELENQFAQWANEAEEWTRQTFNAIAETWPTY